LVADYSHIKRCLDLGQDDVAAAVESRERTRELLQHLAKVAEPGTGAAKSLLVFARMATTACGWLDGDLRVDIVGDADVCAVEVLEELGMGMRERVFPPLAFAAPLDEFVRAVERVPHMIAPLTVKSKTPRRMVLGATAELRRSSLPPALIKIAEESFFVPKAPPAPVASRPPPAAPKKITLKREALPPELPLVVPARPPPLPPSKPAAKSVKPAAKSVKPPAKKSVKPAAKKSVKPPAKSARPPAKSAKPSAKEAEDVDSGWDDE
jgi:hypothetical protein